MEERRLLAAAMFAKGKKQAEVVRRLQVSRTTAARWYASYDQGGRKAMKRTVATGRPRRLSVVDCKKLERLLLQGARQHGYMTDLWTSARVLRLIEQRFAVHYHRNHVPKLLDALGWSCQRPQGRAVERDEVAIERWKKVTWPRLKKKS